MLKERLGLFDDPYRRGKQSRISGCTPRIGGTCAREMAARSIVMLKNDERCPAD